MKAAATSAAPVRRGSSRSVVSRDELEQFFVQVGTRLEKAEARLVPRESLPLVSHAELRPFFAAVSHCAERAEVQQRRRDKRLATGFNVFDLIEPDENKLSDILADLLDPKGSHGQGDLFLRLLLQQLDLGKTFAPRFIAHNHPVDVGLLTRASGGESCAHPIGPFTDNPYV